MDPGARGFGQGYAPEAAPSTPIIRGRGRVVAAIGAAALTLALPALALAHPLGNFTINHYAGIRVEPDRVLLDVVIDQAEIPTFQEKLRIDTDGDGSVSDAEAEAERIAACPIQAGTLSLTVGGRSLALVPVAAGLTFPAGAAGLETMRLVCTYAAALPGPMTAGTRITFADGSHTERLGWREIVVTGSGVIIAGAGLPTSSASDRLTAYPRDLLDQPLDVRSADFAASPGGPIRAPFASSDALPLAGASALGSTGGDVTGADAGATPIASPSAPTATPSGAAVASASVPGGGGVEISGLLESRDLTPLVLLGSIAAALALGAGHALTPGHGKTLIGAYLVGTRGTSVHAVALGLSVTVSHTLGILVLAAIVIAFRGVLPPETFNRYAPVASGILVLGIGVWLLVGQSRARRTRMAASAHDHQHDHSHHVEAHDHATEGYTHAQEAAEPETHSHGGIRHSHVPPSASSVTWRSLFLLGLAGGIIPSTNALIILLATIASGRAVYGLVLVIAFGLGMALVLGGVGLGLVFARDQVERLPSRSSLGRVASHAPVMAGMFVFGLGLYLTTQAVGVSPAF